ncbi:BspA family leucine-rich repeat surface protein [Listeria seeligeri]|uniref:BspA family leucine-rich repeat surface protein n=1 Tax=Listeria seeligeri TaxID=1640 RepID=UPI00162A4C50|nr:BspA family leucine-rich repeat surface protein [Listeria seeligeri]MBC1722879.1 BspA family leucine-rich repeat surface protein [Listeria seeligeri]MBF2436739.1 BspA family leucine-rich repeat surface protein [Listeria seeligeri]
MFFMGRFLGTLFPVNKLHAGKMIRSLSAKFKDQEACADIATGVFGTSEWRIDSEGTLHIGEGVFAKSSAQSPWSIHSKVIKKITFESKVKSISDSLSYLFNSLELVTQIEGISFLDTTESTDMQYMFSGLRNLVSLDVASFNTCKVTNMDNMFFCLSSIECLDLANFNTSNVTTMRAMFAGMTKLKVLDVTSFDTTKVTNMVGMFYNLKNLEVLKIANFNINKVITANQMFSGLDSLKYLSLGDFNKWKIIHKKYNEQGEKINT